VGVAASLTYFVVSSLMPEASWINIDLLLQFQPASLVLYGACFLLGLLACSGRWFAGEAFPGRVLLWGPATALLIAGFFVVGHGVFAHPVTSNRLSSGLLLSFSFIRTFLCLSVLVLIVAYARTRRNRPSRLNAKLAANSYNIYLCHLFFVVFLQDVLMIWRGGPAMAKATVVFFAVLPMSYGVSRVMDRFPRSFSIGLVAVFILLLCL
jgi:glucans biosynthesis protein C